MKHRINTIIIGWTLIGLTAVAVATAAPPKKPSKPKAVQPKKDMNKNQITQGHTLFITNCAVCHGANGAGDDGPSLQKKHMNDSFIAIAIRKGFKNEMPPFGNKLKEKEIKSVVAYVHSLQ